MSQPKTQRSGAAGPQLAAIPLRGIFRVVEQPKTASWIALLAGTELA